MFDDDRGVDGDTEGDLGTRGVAQGLHAALVPACCIHMSLKPIDINNDLIALTFVPLLHIEDDEGSVVAEVYPVLDPDLDAVPVLGPLDVGDAVPLVVVHLAGQLGLLASVDGDLLGTLLAHDAHLAIFRRVSNV